jgi:hypothetical protein
MRALLTLGLILATSPAASAQGQPKKEKDKDRPAASRMVLAGLQTEVRSTPFREGSLKFSRFLAALDDLLKAAGKEVRFVVDEQAFREVQADFDVLEQEIRLRNLPANVGAGQLLRQALGQLPVKAAFIIRAGKVDLIPYAQTAKEFMLNQTFHADFSERRLDQALEDLTELTGVSIVIDGRARQKAQTLVTARFNDDVAVQDAVRMLADMAELKIVYLVTGLYVTTPEHASVMRKELLKAYGYPETMPAPPAGGAMIGNPGGMVGGAPDPLAPPIDSSPLMPPLPPSRSPRTEAAASLPVGPPSPVARSWQRRPGRAVVRANSNPMPAAKRVAALTGDAPAAEPKPMPALRSSDGAGKMPVNANNLAGPKRAV